MVQKQKQPNARAKHGTERGSAGSTLPTRPVGRFTRRYRVRFYAPNDSNFTL